MQLNVREVARIFDVPENRVDRWISEHKLPCRAVGGERYFNRTELLEWATVQRIHFSPSLLDEAAFGTGTLANALAFGGISEHVSGTDKSTVLHNVVKDLPLPDGFDREGLVELMLAREADGTTTVGDGIAIPHARRPIVLPVERPILRLCFLSQAIDFGAADRLPVRTLFVLIAPTIRSHLRTLAAIAAALRDDRFRDAIRQRRSLDVIVSIAQQLGTKVDGPADSIPTTADSGESQ